MDPDPKEIAHDIQAQLAIIVSLCDHLSHAELGVDAAADVGRLRANAQRVVDGVHTLAAVQTSTPRRRGQVRPVDLAASAWSVAADLRLIASRRGQRLVTSADPGSAVLGDADALRSALTNLVTNAMRAAPDGGVIRCTVRRRRDRVCVAVADDGPGIAPEQRAIVLRAYERGADADQADGGMGLGLAIVQRIIDEHRGRLTIGSAAEGGALVTFDLPAISRRARAAGAAVR